MNWKTFLGAFGALFLLGSCQEQTLEERADALHARILTLDSHNDTPLRFRLPEYDIMQDNPGVCVDYPKMVAGGLDGAFFAAYIRQGARDSLSLEAATQRVLTLIDDIRHMSAEHPDQFALATTPEEGLQSKQAGKRAVYIGVENGYAIERDFTFRDGKYYDVIYAEKGGAARKYDARSLEFGYDNLHAPSADFAAWLAEEIEKCGRRIAAAERDVPALRGRMQLLREVRDETLRNLR